MFLTKSQLYLIRKLDDDQERDISQLIIPTDEEYAFMDSIAGKMTLDDYLALPEPERKKWYINCNPGPPRLTGGTDAATGEEIYSTGFFFEPWHPNILDRIY
ncbi:hypothetical protein [uncultured Akkermansia sp.]|mgnify:FL=1|uniref:hypothetical protein n=1 Tax=uncultured Akkermansia sp. TaxID=512294 RepID=UPI0025E63DDC|nr:hypothetical protein [uncultured Akkermansia sp.]